MWPHTYTWQAGLTHAEIGYHDELLLDDALVGSRTMPARSALAGAKGWLGEEIGNR